MTIASRDVGCYRRQRLFPRLRSVRRVAPVAAVFGAVALLSPAPAFPQEDITATGRIYTAPDPTASGGIRGSIASPAMPIEQIIAIPFDQPQQAYAGTILGNDRREFRFEGLPMNRYDLIVIYPRRFYEGLTLHRGADTLTDVDRQRIVESVERSEPFFTVKIAHRIEGTHGRGNEARALCTYLRDSFSYAGAALEERREEHRRTFKLVVLRDVGPGWQIVRARDLYPVYIDPEFNRPDHHYAESLRGIRVTDYVRDIGELNLTR